MQPINQSICRDFSLKVLRPRKTNLRPPTMKAFDFPITPKPRKHNELKINEKSRFVFWRLFVKRKFFYRFLDRSSMLPMDLPGSSMTRRAQKKSPIRSYTVPFNPDFRRLYLIMHQSVSLNPEP